MCLKTQNSGVADQQSETYVAHPGAPLTTSQSTKGLNPSRKHPRFTAFRVGLTDSLTKVLSLLLATILALIPCFRRQL
jgi:hypothetical protein